MSEADLLRRAATLMRERAEAAAPGPWAQPVANVFRVIAPEAPHTNPRIGKTPPYPWRVVVEAGDSRHAEDTAAADATHIAAWHPGVALAVADWMETCAVLVDKYDFPEDGLPLVDRALIAATKADLERLRRSAP